MTKKVNNINYKGIAHTPSLVSDNDGVAAECINLAPDNGDLKPMPMPVKKSDTYQVEDNSKIIFIHKGVGYENFVEIYSVTGDVNTKLYLKDSDGNFLYVFDDNGTTRHYWSNGSEIVTVQGIGDTLVISTKAGTEYLLYRKDIAPSSSGTGISTTSSYKPIGQRPPMPVIEFQMYDNPSTTEGYMKEYQQDDLPSGEEVYDIIQVGDVYYISEQSANGLTDFFKALITKLEKRIKKNKRFYQPFFIRYAIKPKTGDYIMHSPPVLLLPSGMKNPLGAFIYSTGVPNPYIYKIGIGVDTSKLRYNVHNASDFSDWSDIVSSVDVFISEPIDNYNYQDLNGCTYNNGSYIIEDDITGHDFGWRYVNGEINPIIYTGGQDVFLFTINGYDESQMNKKIEESSIFHKITSLDLGLVSSISSGYTDLPIEDLENLANLPTLPDDYNSHNAISPTLMQTYNNRLNMANVKQEVFKGFENAYQPQSSTGYYRFTKTVGMLNYDIDIYADRVYFKIKKNGKTYTVLNPTLGDNDTAKLDYTTYLYYPDADCFEAVVRFRFSTHGGASYTTRYCTIPMKRHEHLNGSFWYDDMECLGKYIGDEYAAGHTSEYPPSQDSDSDLWYSLGNRFMMSAVGNPWYFPVNYMKEIGIGEIRSLTLNPENMSAPQFGQNPIYAFSTDGIWTISINNDGTPGEIKFVSGDVVSEPQGLGTSPTASSEQLTFFKTENGIMMMAGSKRTEIDLCMKGRVFNPRIKLLPANSVYNGIPESGAMSSMSDIIDNACDSIPYATFAKTCSLTYDYINKRLLLFNRSYPYMYVYDIRYDFWSKMYPTTAQDGQILPIDDNPSTRTASSQPTFTSFSSIAMSGLLAVVQDTDGYLWYVGDQSDENSITERKLGLYVSKPIRFGTDDYKTLCNVVHNTQLSSTDIVRMALYGSRDGQQYWRMGTLKGTSYKFFVIVLYTCMLPSSRYAYTAFEWEARLSNKIR